MRYVLAFAALWFLAVMSVSAMPYIRVLGVTPDLVLIFAASWAVVRGQDEALVVVPAAGLMKDLLTSDPLGTSVLAMAPIVLIAAATQLRAVDTSFIPTIATVAAGSLAYGIISMMVLAATGHSVPVGAGLLTFVLPGIVVNSLFTPIIYLPVHWLGHRPGPGFYTTRRMASTL